MGMLAIAGILGGCCQAKTNLLSKGGDAMEVISVSASSDCCVKKAKEVADEHCKLKGKLAVVTDEKTDYQGADKTVKAAVGLVGALAGKRVQSDDSEDYRTNMKFKCQ